MLNNKSLEALVAKIDAFIRLYYKNQIIRGIIYSVALLVVFFLVLNLLEYFSYFGQTVRALLFFGYITIAFVILSVYIIVPLLKLFRVGKIISYEQAAAIISRHFPEISDKLINTLQLGKMMEPEKLNLEMVEAAIAQKTEKIKSLPFTDAIDKKENVRKTPYALVPVLIVIILLVAAPTLIKDPAKRISNYHLQYERPAPFRFIISDNILTVLKGDDLDLSIKLEGSELPAEVFIEYANTNARTVRLAKNEFVYRFRNLNEDVHFRLLGEGFYSETYNIKVLPKPVIITYSVTLEFPDYTKRADENISNTGDFSIPRGTLVTWVFNTESTDSININTSISDKPLMQRGSDNEFRGKIRAMQSMEYVVVPINKHAIARDSLLHQLTVIPDIYPEINVEAFIDSSSFSSTFFTGQIKDDYGFDKLEFHYTRQNIKTPDRIIESGTSQVNIDKNINSQSFFYTYDFSGIEIEPGDRIDYWFEIWDNDRVMGSKSSRSVIGAFEIPGMAEREKQIAEKQTEVSTEISQLQKELFELSREIEQLQKSILQKESISWEDTNKLNEMLEKQASLQEKSERIKDNHAELNRMQDKATPFNEELIRKQQELQKLFDELMTDEMKRMFEELQKMLEDLDRSKMQDMLEKMEMSNEELLQNLDRNLELFKQLEIEKKITETVAKLKELAQKQDELAEQSKNPDADTENLDKQQAEIENEFQEIKEELAEIEKQNEELESQYEMIETDELEQEIESSMQKSRENLQNNQKSKASPHQKDASQKMDMLSENLMNMMMEGQNDQLGEDIRLIRKLLEDLIDVSFDQEGLIDKTVRINTVDPRYNELLSEQNKINTSLQQIEDSLQAIAKRQAAIQPFVLREIAQINNNVEEALKSLEARDTRTTSTRQQFIMTSVNNLALMLGESMEQMMQQMASQSSDGEACPMPGQGQGKGKPSMSTMKDLQQQLNQQLEQMQKGKGKPGEQGMPQPGGQSMSEQFARMAAQQEALRRQMQQYLEEVRKETGGNDGNAVRAIEEMEETEKDLVNKRISNETLMRQERIMTRLLESERAEMEREREERRESREAQNYPLSNSDSVLEFYRKKMNEREMLRTVPPQLNSFYRTKVNDYFIQVQ
jgi:hypothetical protein